MTIALGPDEAPVFKNPCTGKITVTAEFRKKDNGSVTGIGFTFLCPSHEKSTNHVLDDPYNTAWFVAGIVARARRLWGRDWEFALLDEVGQAEEALRKIDNEAQVPDTGGT